MKESLVITLEWKSFHLYLKYWEIIYNVESEIIDETLGKTKVKKNQK